MIDFKSILCFACIDNYSSVIFNYLDTLDIDAVNLTNLYGRTNNELINIRKLNKYILDNSLSGVVIFGCSFNLPFTPSDYEEFIPEGSFLFFTLQKYKRINFSSRCTCRIKP